MIFRHTIILVSLCCCVLSATARETVYRSGSVKAAVTALGIADIVDTLSPGQSTFAYKGKQVYVRINNEREVVNVGMPLFAKTLKQLQPSPIYDFLEYALLDNTFSISDNPFTYKNVRFGKGKWHDLLSVDDNTSVSINNIDGKYYKIVWTNGKHIVAEVSFPIQYDMLSGSTHIEQENNFVRDLERYVPHPVHADSIVLRDTSNLELRLTDGGVRYYVNKGETLYTENITGDTYYIMGTDSVIRLLYDNRYPAETLCNVFLEGAFCAKDVAVTIMGQDFQQRNLQTSVSTLASFLKANGCRNFFGLKKNTVKELSFSIYAENRSSGYTHLFVFTCNPHYALNGNTPLNAKAFLYIPTSNIKSLFAENKTL